MILRQIPNFNIRQIAESGQCFRIMQEPAGSQNLRPKAAPAAAQSFCSETEPAGGQPDTVWRMISGSHYLRLLENENGIYFFCPEEEFPFWENYFDLAEDYGLFLSSVQSSDPYLKKAAEYGSGIRILRQDLWEMIITFVISQQKTIPAIRSLVEALAKTYGQKLAIPKECQELPFSSDCRDVDCGFFYAFPTPEELARASLSELQSMKLGYRAKYIKRLCEDACSGALDLAHLSRLGYQEAMDYLQGFYGIGKKWPIVSACSAFIISTPSPWIPGSGRSCCGNTRPKAAAQSRFPRPAFVRNWFKKTFPAIKASPGSCSNTFSTMNEAIPDFAAALEFPTLQQRQSS